MEFKLFMFIVIACVVFLLSYQPRTGVLTKYLKPETWTGPDVWLQDSQGVGERFGNDRKEVVEALKPMAETDSTDKF